MKKFFKIIGVILLLFILVLITIPFVLESKIDKILTAYLENNVNAQVSFDDVSLSLISSFPNAEVSIDNISIINNAPFEGETLATSKSMEMKMPIKELFKNQDEEPITITSVNLKETLLTIKNDKEGRVNYDVLKTKEGDSTSNGFSFKVNDYKVDNSALTYIDEESDIGIYITELNHSGNGEFTENLYTLETTSEANVSLSIDSTSYLNNQHVNLDALFDIDLNNNTYTFKENQGFINKLPIEFAGYVQQREPGQFIDITFMNPESSFKDLLAVMPEQYSKNLDDVDTTGDFVVNGLIRGLSSDTTIPELDISISSSNASFKYPDLPKRVENISINAIIKNETGYSKDTYVDLKTLNFKIDEDVFKSSATIRNLTDNMQVDADIDGTLNLANLSQAYPNYLKQELSGILKGKLNTSFDMQAVNTNAYQRIKSNGYLSVSNMSFSSEELKQPIKISKADLKFNPGNVALNSFQATSGTSDLSATGTIQNLLGFILSDQELKGNFNVMSNTFKVSDFLVEELKNDDALSNNSSKTALKIPDLLDCTINASATTVIYDNLKLSNVKGVLQIKNEEAIIKDLTSTIFDGALSVAGTVSTKGDVPSFNLNLGAAAFDISKSFNDLELFQSLVPVAKLLEGKLNTAININGFLNESFTPDLKTVSGDALAEITTSSIDVSKGEVLKKLGTALDFVDFDQLDLKNLKTQITFENGLVNVKPFGFNYKDIAVEVSGSHNFKNSMNFNAVFNVPAKYLGSEVNRLIGKIDDPKVNNISIPVVANISGSYTSPTVTTDLTSAVSKFKQQLVEIQKEKLKNEGKDKINDILGDILKTKKETTDQQQDSLKTDSSAVDAKDPIKKGITSALDNLLKKTKKQKVEKPQDSIKN